MTQITDEKKKQLLRALALVFLFVAVITYGSFTYLSKHNKSDPVVDVSVPYVTTYDKAMDKIVTDGDPTELQRFFLNSVKNGKNDDKVKSAIYWITHRYFDNGGDIVEIYQYINSNPELHFINEYAEKQYPDLFLKVKDKSIVKYSSESTLILLSYYDIIDSRGYANFAMWGLAANKYAEMAYSIKFDKKFAPKLSKDNRLSFEGSYRQSAYRYIQKIDTYFRVTTQKNNSINDLSESGIPDTDRLVGVNQYISAIAYLKALGLITDHPFEMKDMYEYANNLAETKVNRLYFFTNYLYATTLVASGDATKETVKVPLERAVKYAEMKKDDPVLRPKGSIRRVIDSNINGEPSIFSYSNTKKLASLSPSFKEWLKSQGWKDSDF